jgi:hypothetical protein
MPPDTQRINSKTASTAICLGHISKWSLNHACGLCSPLKKSVENRLWRSKKQLTMTAHYVSSLFNRDVPTPEPRKRTGERAVAHFFPRRPVSIQWVKPCPSQGPTGLVVPHFPSGRRLISYQLRDTTSSQQFNPGNLEKTSLIHEKKTISARFAKYEQDLSLNISSVSVQRDKTVKKSRSGEGSIVGS